MTSAAELVRKLTQREAIPVELLTDVDVIELAQIVGLVIEHQPIPGAGEWLAGPTSVEPVSGAGATGASAGLSAAIFARAVLAGEESADRLAADVDPLALALLCVGILLWPAFREPRGATGRARPVDALAERRLALGEDLCSMQPVGRAVLSLGNGQLLIRGAAVIDCWRAVAAPPWPLLSGVTGWCRRHG